MNKKLNRQTQLGNGSILIECRICDKIKLLEEFPKHPHGKHGKDTRCKACRKT